MRRELQQPRSRDELFAREVFDPVVEAKVIYGEWGAEYNNERPHSSLRGMTPVQLESGPQAPGRQVRANIAMWLWDRTGRADSSHSKFPI
jgi:hypothetical protein